MATDVNVTAEQVSKNNDWVFVLRRPPVMGLLIIVLMFCEKMLAHTYTVFTLHVLPAPWKYVIPFVIGSIGLWMVIAGLKRDEVKGSLLGYSGAILIWMSWIESAMPVLARAGNIPKIIPPDGNVMAGFMGEHVFLQMSGLFCIVTLIFIMFNKDMRCRMLLWIRRKIGLGAATVGVPTKGYRPTVARVAAFEYIYVTWFMYVLMLVIVDPRSFGMNHPVTIALSLALGAWGLYLMFLQTKQREMGMGIRYGIGAVGVGWFVPEALSFYGLFDEFYLRPDKYPIVMLFIGLLFVGIWRVIWTTPINEKTQQSL